jgi:hypothetical protein
MCKSWEGKQVISDEIDMYIKGGCTHMLEASIAHSNFKIIYASSTDELY